jgi:hypothetical protein
MSRFRAIMVVAFSSAALACGGADPAPSAEPPAADENDPENAGEPAGESELAFSIVGREGPMGAQAQLRVTEGDPIVHLAITGGDEGSNVILINLAFEGLNNAMGAHVVEFDLPFVGDHMANANFDGTSYYSQGGEIDLSLSRDGHIEGRFNVALAPDSVEAGGEPVVFTRIDEPTPVSGVFNGQWSLFCRSHLPGHQSLIEGGQFCEDLQF